jgi:SEC-C motif-containing protein
VAAPTPPPGRNDPCYCGSGKKYKQCHLDLDEAEARAARASSTADQASEEASGPEKPSPPAPRHNTRQPWKGTQNTRGFQKANLPRRSGGS